MSTLANVHIICFAASYAVALALEVTRLFFRAPIRLLVIVGFTAAGLVAHTAFVWLRANPDPQIAPPLSSWFDWLLLLAWGVAAIYLITLLRRPQAALGIFMLPVVLVLIAVAALFRHAEPFPRDQALYIWGMIHGVALLLGSLGVSLGFVAGVMYLLQSYRLKHKIPPRPGLKLPSLEWLQQANKRTLLASSCLLVAGLLAGVVLNLVKHADRMPWSDPVVWTSGLLLLWLVAVLVFESVYKPARQGRKVAYLTVASFVVLGLVLSIVLLGPSQHASPQSRDAGGAAHRDMVPEGVPEWREGWDEAADQRL